MATEETEPSLEKVLEGAEGYLRAKLKHLNFREDYEDIIQEGRIHAWKFWQDGMRPHFKVYAWAKNRALSFALSQSGRQATGHERVSYDFRKMAPSAQANYDRAKEIWDGFFEIHGRHPKIHELASELGMGVKATTEIVKKIKNGVTVYGQKDEHGRYAITQFSLEEELEDNASSPAHGRVVSAEREYFLATGGLNFLDMCENDEMAEAIYLHFWKDLTTREIAARLRPDQSHAMGAKLIKQGLNRISYELSQAWESYDR